MTRCRACPAPRTAGDDRARDERPARAARDGQADAGELTSREREIAALVAGGLSNREIADRLFISRRTVDAHVNHIYAKLRISSRVQLTIWERDRGPGSRSGQAVADHARVVVLALFPRAREVS